MSWKLKPHKRESLTSFWIFLNIFLAPPTSNQRWQCIDHFVSGQFWYGIFVSFNAKTIIKKTHFTCYWLRFIICFWECACVKGGEWVKNGCCWVKENMITNTFSVLIWCMFWVFFLLMPIWRVRWWTILYCQSYPDALLNRMVLKHLLFKTPIV